jgi:hypothetical protein
VRVDGKRSLRNERSEGNLDLLGYQCLVLILCTRGKGYMRSDGLG